MNFTTTLTSKNQLTLPKSVREKIKVKAGVKFDIYPTADGFVGRIRRKSRLLEFAGDLQNVDEGSSIDKIRQKSQELAAKQIVNK